MIVLLNKASNKVNAYGTAHDELLSINSDVSIHQKHFHLKSLNQ